MTPADTQKANGGNPPVVPLHGGDTTTKPPKPSNVRPGGTTKPPVGRDTAGHGPFPNVTAVTLPEVEDIFDDRLRDGARLKAEAIYRRADVTDSIRAMAADMVSAAYQQDNRLQDAITWGERASKLQPNNDKLKTHLSMLRQALGN